jgi:hypothetical protein
VVKPGETLTVLVASPANVKFASVIIGGEAIGIAGMATSLPARFTVTIPADAPCGKQPLTAMAHRRRLFRNEHLRLGCRHGPERVL